MANRRQKLVDAMRTRFQTITTVGGYQTNLGANVNEWRTESVPEGEMPALLFRDERVETPLPEKNTGSQKHLLHVTVDLVVGESAEQATVARNGLEDVIRAIGTDPLWKVANVQLAERTIPGSEFIMADKEGNWIGGARLEFVIEYFTAPWSAD